MNQESTAGSQKMDQLFGEVTLKKGYATSTDVLEGLKIQGTIESVFHDRLFLGEILLIKGTLNFQQYDEIVAEIKGEDSDSKSSVALPMLGEVLKQQGAATVEQILQALEVQIQDEAKGKERRLLGRIMLDEGMISPDQLDMALDELTKKRTQESQTPRPPSKDVDFDETPPSGIPDLLK